MIFRVADVLSPEKIAEFWQLKDALEFVDGKATAGWHAKLVKQNRQASASDALEAVQKIVVDAVAANPIIRSFAMPRRISPPLVSCYAGGENYGLHVDEPNHPVGVAGGSGVPEVGSSCPTISAAL